MKALYDATLPEPVDDPTAVRRFMQALAAKKEISLQTLAYFLSISPNSTLANVILTTRNHDLTEMGQQRLAGGKSSVSAVGKTVCGFCSAVGHEESQCRKRKRAQLELSGTVATLSGGGASKSGVNRPRCDFCHRNHYGVCYVKHPEKAPPGWKKPVKKGGASNSAAGAAAEKSLAQKVPWTEKKRNPKLRNPGKVASIEDDAESVSMLIIGAIDSEFQHQIAVDTGAQEQLVIVTDASLLSSSTKLSQSLGTAAKGGTLQITHSGTADQWTNIFHSPNLQFSVCSGGKLRAYGYFLVDSCPPVLLNRLCEPVLTGKHVKGVPTFSAAELFALPRLPPINLMNPVPALTPSESIA